MRDLFLFFQINVRNVCLTRPHASVNRICANRVSKFIFFSSDLKTSDLFNQQGHPQKYENWNFCHVLRRKHLDEYILNVHVCSNFIFASYADDDERKDVFLPSTNWKKWPRGIYKESWPVIFREYDNCSWTI